MKKEECVASAKPVVECQWGCGYRPVRLVLRQNTAGAAIFKELGNIFEAPDVRVAVNGMTIVEMKIILEMIGIDGRNSGEDEDDIE